MRRGSQPSAERGQGVSRGRVVDAPTNGEWRVWWAIPWPARLYNTVVVLAAVATTLVAVIGAHVASGAPGTLAALVVAGMATVELGRLAEGGRYDGQRIHKGLSAWPFAAALLLPAGLAGVVAAAVYAHAWVRGIRITRWKWIGSCAIVTVAALSASAVFQVGVGGRLPATGSLATLGAALAALATFLVVETGLLFVISRLNTPEDEQYLRTQLAGPGFYLVEVGVLASGVLAAVLFRYSPGFLLLAGPASLLIQRGMLHQPLKDEARRDPKTGVLNCEAWRATAGGALRDAARDDRVAVLVVDIDHFKAVNDSHGHLAGDEVLVHAAEVVLGTVRRTDLVGRFGGDEFCVLLPDDPSFDEAVVVAERICGQIAGLRFTDPELRVTASIGVAIADGGGRGTDLADLLAAADRALYDAKDGGRNRVHVRSLRTTQPA